MNSYRCKLSHPYGVKPPGNAYFESNTQILNSRRLGLGRLHGLSDENLLEFLSYLPATTVAQIIQTSKAFYVFGHHSDIWRDLTIREWNGHFIEYTQSWKDTFASMFIKLNNKNVQFEHHIPI